MKNEGSSEQEISDSEWLEEIPKIKCFSLGNGDGAGLLPDENVGEGDDIVAYLYKGALDHTYSVGRVVPAEDAPPIEEYTLGVRELIVRGRVGYCSDQQTQTSWPVLLAPHILMVSPEHATEGTDVEDQAIKATVPTTPEPDIWPPALTEEVVEKLTDVELIDDETLANADIQEHRPE